MLAFSPRLAAAVATLVIVLSGAPALNAQPYGGPAGFAPPGPPPPRPGYGPPMMRAPNWVTVETSGGQTWDGIWTFDRGHRTMSGSWVNRQTGARVYARRMFVRQEGRQLIITRPPLGNYVGTLSNGGRSISGTMSWVSGRFTARM
jgi:hypothetical protein